MHATLRLLPIAAVVSMLAACGGHSNNNGSSTTATTPPTTTPPTTPATSSSAYTPGNLLVSRTAYDSSFSVSGVLPYNATPTTTNSAPVSAVSPGTFPNVFTNDANDANFGVTSEAYIDQWSPTGTAASQTLDVTALAAKQGSAFSTSFASKSELALNVSLDSKSVTFVGYNAAINQLDISNSNTPGIVDTTNTDVATATYRTVGQMNFADSSLAFTNTNAYAGNNGRSAVLANGQYYIVGNAGNSGKNPKPTTALLDMLTNSSGVQAITPGSTCAYTQVIGAFQSGTGTGTYTPAASGTACSLASIGTIANGSSTGDQFGFSLASLGTAADKTGKDDNFRGLYVGPDGTMYVSKGSGGNGVNTVYQVGAAAALANGGTLTQNVPITIVPGFPTALAANLTNLTSPSQVTGTVYPFGMWIPASNPALMFVADEGDGVAGDQVSGSGGLWVYQKTGSTWAVIGHLTTGLNLGTAYTITDTAGIYGSKGASYTTTPDGLRQITGQTNADGSFTLYATTSTIGASLGTAFDAGAESNQLVKITLNVTGSTVSSASGFTLMQTAPYGQALRGVAIVPKF